LATETPLTKTDTRPPVSEMIAFFKEYRKVCGVEPICRVLQIAPSTFYAHLAIESDPDKASDRVKRDAELRPEMKRVWDDNRSVYGARKLWRAMRRDGFDLARCTVERLMRDIGIEGVRRGKKIKTTWPDKALPCPLDRVNRQFRATIPNQLWVSDFTYVSTWQGFVYVAFVIDTFANKIVGWRASRSQQTQFVLDALEQALYERQPTDNLIHHSDRGSQGGFNRSSQHPILGGVDDENRPTKIRTFDTGQIKLARKTASLAT